MSKLTWKACQFLTPLCLPRKGILNDHPIFDTIVDISPDGQEATASGIEIGMVGDANTRAASWEFNVFRNRFIKDRGLWKLQGLDITPTMVSNYSAGWGNGSIVPQSGVIPPFLSVAGRSSRFPGMTRVATDLLDLQRRLNRSAGYDEIENVSGAYGYYADDQRCDGLGTANKSPHVVLPRLTFAGTRPGTLHAKKGNKLSPFAGWYLGTDRIARACHETYGGPSSNPSPMRSSISFHWRPQPVIRVSPDGRSASFRSRLFQPSASNASAGSFSGAIYHDQFAVEPDDGGKWKIWSLTIDEHYFSSAGWVGGWSGANPAPTNASKGQPYGLTVRYPPDVTLVDIGDRESSFRGGSGRALVWPEIQKMWFAYRNPVSGRVPEYYWPGCVPCQFRPEWNLTSHGYQEPTTGPVTAESL